MKNKLSPKQWELYEFIDKLLYYDWKPIPADNLPRDEYESYVPHIFGMVINGSSTIDITEHLSMLEVKEIGLGGSWEHNLDIAEKIIGKKEELSL